MFGLWDARGRCWLGDDHGPKLFEDQELARAAATVASEQLGYTIRAIPFDGKNLRYKDKVPCRMGTLAAIQKIEARDQKKAIKP
jgi:hypothetical protein